MTKALFRDTLRAIRNTLSRFISIVIIVALGVGFFAGLKAVSPNMKAAAEKFYQTHNLADIVINSTVGFDDEDLQQVMAVPGVTDATLSRFVDGILMRPDGTQAQSLTGTAYVLRIIGYDFTQTVDTNSDRLNQLELIQGRFPQRPDECVASVYENNKEPQYYKLGQKIRVVGDHADIKDTVRSEYYTVVGTVNTPEFVSMELGASQAGGGELSGYVYIDDRAFATDYYTTMYVGVENSGEKAAYTEEYKDLVRKVSDRLSAAGGAIVKRRAERMKDYYLPIIEKGKAELEQAKIDMEKLKDAVENGPAQYAAEKKNAEDKIAAAEKKLVTGRAEYDKKLAEYNAGNAKYNEALKVAEQHPGALEEYQAGQNKVERAQASYDIAKTAVSAGKSALRVAQQALESGDPTRISNAMEIFGLYFPIEDTDKTVEGLKKRVEEAQKSLNEQEAALADAKKEIDAGKAELKKAEALLGELEKLNKAGKELQAAKAKLDAAAAELKAGPAKIAAAKEEMKRQLEKAEKDLANAQTKNRTAAQELENGERKIRVAENQTAALASPQWMVLDRDEFAGYSNYGNTADNMEQFALIFPVLFFLIAALVSLTTMTRMVEDERTQLGVLKAAGYSTAAISFKYLFYAFTAGLLGSIIGTVLGFSLIPVAIFNAYKILYLIPEMTPGFFAGTAALGGGFALLSTVGAVLYSVLKAMRHRPSELMRPKAPKAGKQVFLEKIPALWSRLGFNGKVTVRNLVRNKDRFFMTLVGIMGCTALLLTGFGIGNSIGTMLDKQFGTESIMRFDGQALLQSPLHEQDVAAMMDTEFNQPDRIKSVMPVFMKKMYAGVDGVDHQIDATIVVAQDKSRIADFAKLTDEKTGKPVQLNDAGAFINGKTAELLGLKLGDYITVQSGAETAKIKVAAITRNYIYHYIYMTPQVYQQGFGVPETTYNIVMLRLEPELTKFKGSDAQINEVKQKRTDLVRELSDTAEVITVVYNQSIIDSVGKMIKVMQNVIVAVFTVAAGALAFVVLYNLNNINIYERIRELATIKVLGFYDKEADMFIYRENIITSILGIGAGLALGIPIHGLVIRAAEIESMMFVRTLAPQNFFAAAIITALFAVLINLLMHKKIQNISMVESLKSVE